MQTASADALLCCSLRTQRRSTGTTIQKHEKGRGSHTYHVLVAFRGLHALLAKGEEAKARLNHQPNEAVGVEHKVLALSVPVANNGVHLSRYRGGLHGMQVGILSHQGMLLQLHFEMFGDQLDRHLIVSTALQY